MRRLGPNVPVSPAEVAKMRRGLLAIALLAYPAGSLWAEPDEAPGPGVARLSLINGDVSVRRGDSGDWVAATINSPIIAPDTVFVGGGSRAEVQLDYANLIRLAANTEVRFARLDQRRYQLQIARGTVTFTVLRDSDRDVDLSTPNISVRPLRKGSYRVSVRDDGTTEVTVRAGEADIFTPRGSEMLRPGKTMIVRGTASEPEFQTTAALAEDEWDRFNEQRDRDLRRSAAYRYVSRDIYGVEDLDAFGRWVYVPPYGWVWAPYVAPGWAPYRYGRWAWLDFYGWTWIGYDPWGWAPYHWGRWFYHGPYGWCWWPGPIYVRHYWRPALVAFFGWSSYSGFQVGVGVGFGRIGWVPLAPFEPYYPWYGPRYWRGGPRYIDNSVHIVNNVNIVNVYRNARFDNAVTAVDATEFGRGRVANLHRASEIELRRVSLVRGEVPVVPQRDSLRFADRPVLLDNLPAQRREQFAGRWQAQQQPERIPFVEHQQRLERVARQVAEEQANPRLRSSARGAIFEPRTAETPRGAAGHSWRSASEPVESPLGGASIAEGWRRFGEPSRPGRQAREFPSRSEPEAVEPRGRGFEPMTPRAIETRRGEERRGWRRFGEPTRSIPEAERDASGGIWESRRSDRWYGSRERSRSEAAGENPPAPLGRWDIFGRRAPSRGHESERPSRGEGYPEPVWRGGRGIERESVPISPPMIRERPSPRWGGSSRSGGVFGEGGRSPRWGRGPGGDAPPPGGGEGVFGGPVDVGGPERSGEPGGELGSPRFGGSRRGR